MQTENYYLSWNLARMLELTYLVLHSPFAYLFSFLHSFYNRQFMLKDHANYIGSQ